MEDIILNIRALAAMKEMTIEKLAVECGISPAHLKDVSSGRTRMTIEDLRKLSAYTGVPADNIKS